MYLMLTFRKEIRNVRVAITAVSSICLFFCVNETAGLWLKVFGAVVDGFEPQATSWSTAGERREVTCSPAKQSQVCKKHSYRRHVYKKLSR